MLRQVRVLLPIAAIATALVTREASAVEPFTQNRAAVALSGRYGIPLGKNVSQNPWTNGIGLTYGVTLFGGLYMGLGADTYRFDRGMERYGSEDDQTVIRGRLGSAKVEVGNDWALLKSLVLRGTFGIGPGWGQVRRWSLETDEDGHTTRVHSDEDVPRTIIHLDATLVGKLSRRFFVLGQTEWLYDPAFDDVTTGAIFALGAGYAY